MGLRATECDLRPVTPATVYPLRCGAPEALPAGGPRAPRVGSPCSRRRRPRSLPRGRPQSLPRGPPQLLPSAPGSQKTDFDFLEPGDRTFWSPCGGGRAPRLLFTLQCLLLRAAMRGL